MRVTAPPVRLINVGDVLARVWVKASVVVLLGALLWLFWPAAGADTPDDAAVVAESSSDAAQQSAAGESAESPGLARELSDDAAIAPEVVRVGEDATGSTQSDADVMVLWLLAGATTVLLIGFLVHTSPRRRARNQSRPA